MWRAPFGDLTVSYAAGAKGCISKRLLQQPHFGGVKYAVRVKSGLWPGEIAPKAVAVSLWDRFDA